jgi:hypothetical protein
MTFIIGTPHTKNAGYLGAETGGHNNRKVEADIKTCTHCQAAINMTVWKEDGAWCGKCQAPICGPCGDKMLTQGCLPYVKRLEMILESDEQRAQLRRILGIEGNAPVPSLDLNV